jgi:cyclopropane-fatty-acyl-phospholipid synthase
MNTRTDTLRSDNLPVSLGITGVPVANGQSIVDTERLPVAARAVLSMLSQIKYGQIKVTLPDGRQHLCGTLQEGKVIDLIVHDWQVFGEMIARGDIGAAEAFIDGLWGTDALSGLLTLIARNRRVLEKAIHGRRWQLISAWLLHRMRANTRQGSKRNIMAHYDLGNDFYRLWLDETMTYSSALFDQVAHPDQATWADLPAAQRAKNDRMIRALNIQPGDQVLEVGCGWGGFAEQATTLGAHVTGLTLSPAQQAFARERAATGGWAERADFMLTDYRDMQGQFDHIVSVEMFEAVGERWWPTYFRTLKRLLKPGGRALVQVITIDDALFHSYRRGTDFIQRHVFPGGMLPSPTRFRSGAEGAGFNVCDDLSFGIHYARTLGLWHDAFCEQLVDVKAQGFDDRFIRLWRFYLAYCEAGFRAGSIDVHQYTLQA